MKQVKSSKRHEAKIRAALGQALGRQAAHEGHIAVLQQQLEDVNARHAAATADRAESQKNIAELKAKLKPHRTANAECHCHGECQKCKDNLTHEQSSEGGDQTVGIANALVPEAVLNEMVEILLMNCGGPGSGVPGPCAKVSAHTSIRAHMAAALKVLHKAGEAHAKHGTAKTAKALDAAHHAYMALHSVGSKPEKGKTAPKTKSAPKAKATKTAATPKANPDAPSAKALAAVEKVHGSADKFVDHVVHQHLLATDKDYSRALADKHGGDLVRDKQNKALDSIRSGQADKWLSEALPHVMDKSAATAAHPITDPKEFAHMARQRKDRTLGEKVSNRLRQLIGATL